jgi:hypothetical protein
MYDDIKEWINQISIPRDELGGIGICPYARNSKYKIVKTDKNLDLVEEDVELIIYVLPENYTVNDLSLIAEKQNKKFPHLVFLPDHRDRVTEINGVQTNNGKHNLILCQSRNVLEKARIKLKSTGYYTYWNSKYLEEILST